MFAAGLTVVYGQPRQGLCPPTSRSWKTCSPATGHSPAGLTANLYRRTATAKDARRLARRFRIFEDLILRFATRPDLDIFTNNQAERTIRPVKVQQRGSGGAWRTLDGLADFAIVESYLSTAAKWGITKLDALRDLFNGHAWKPPGLESAG
jgi:transposase